MKKATGPDPKYPAYYDFHVGQAYYVDGFLNQDQEHYATAVTHLRKALTKSPNFRPARTYLAAVLWELGQKSEAKEEMTILIQKLGRPRSQDPGFQEYVRQTHPYENEAITTHLIEVWQDAESQP